MSGIAAEPGSEDAWLALRAPTGADEGVSAVLVHISAVGKVLGAQTLPTKAEAEAGVGPKGAAARISCPALENCWMATTEGWLFHLAPEGERTMRPNEISGFHNVIAYRPLDQGLPQVVADAPPPDTSGLNEEGFVVPKIVKGEESKPASESKVQLPLLSRLHSKLIHHTTLQLSFHLAVKARVRLLAKRHGRLVASTRSLTLKAGSRTISLGLDPRSWPTKLSLQTHALAPLPLVSSVTGEGANVTTVTTGLVVLPHGELASGLVAAPHNALADGLVAAPHNALADGLVAAPHRALTSWTGSAALSARRNSRVRVARARLGAACGRPRHGDRAGTGARAARLAPRLARRRAAGCARRNDAPDRCVAAGR